MGRKYIIELEEKPFFNEKGNALYRVKGFRSLVFDEKGIEMLEPDLTKLRDDAFNTGYARAGEYALKRYIGEKEEAYQKGLNDAWECAKRLFLGVSNGGFANSEIKEIFGYDDEEQVVMKHTAAEAIEKIRQWEDMKIFKPGNEVVSSFGVGIVTKVTRTGVELFHKDGSTGSDIFEAVKKTGRHFPEFVELLAKMKGESNDPD